MHRDIKPENILVVATEPSVEIRVADFGISRVAVDRDSFPGLTGTGLVIGTPFYMAPEVQMGMKYDSTVDIWSIGVSLYQMLYLEQPHGKERGLDNPAIIHFPMCSFVSDELKTFIRRCLQPPKFRMDFDEFFARLDSNLTMK